jgi:hypothetical protein
LTPWHLRSAPRNPLEVFEGLKEGKEKWALINSQVVCVPGTFLGIGEELGLRVSAAHFDSTNGGLE